MIHCRKSPAASALAIVFVSASFGFFAACGDPGETTLISTETHALVDCSDAPSCDDESTSEPESDASRSDGSASEGGGWLSRCASDGECAVGQCVCGVCSESCSGEVDACSGLPAGAECFGGRTLPRAALCHATTVPGICLLPCNTDAECGEGQVCALGACLPEPEASTP